MWTGVSLRSVLADAGILPNGVEIVFTGYDRGEKNGREIPFARSLPISKALEEDVLLAYEMNGEPLPPDHGYPVRLLVPGWYAVASVKWLHRIEVATQPFKGHFQVEKYMIRQDSSDPETPVREMAVSSRIVTPAAGTSLKSGHSCRVSGQAWTGTGAIERVEVSLDGGATWERASLGTPLSPYTWVPWTYPWTPRTPGRYELCSRATDRAGNIQPARAEWNVDGYRQNSIHKCKVSVT